MEFSDEVRQAARDWAHPALLRIWGVVNCPGWLVGKPILRGDDIEIIANAIVELNSAFNKPEVKALVRHLQKSEGDND